MSRKGPEVGQGMLDFEEDVFIGVKLQYSKPHILKQSLTVSGPNFDPDWVLKPGSLDLESPALPSELPYFNQFINI